MPLITLHLFALSPGRATISSYLKALASHSVKPLVASRVIRWIITPEKLSTHLPRQPWDLLLVVPATTQIPSALMCDDWVHLHWSITAGVPKTVYEGFEAKNRRLLHPSGPGDVPPLTGALRTYKSSPQQQPASGSTQSLELDEEVLRWADGFELGRTGAVSMLNLMSFWPGRDAHESYLRYGKAFAESIGARRGGQAKIVGKVLPSPAPGTADEDLYGWDEVALAHYPSIRHFVDMLASDDYQKVNRESRLPALRDTCLLCTSELDPEVLAGLGEGRARL